MRSRKMLLGLVACASALVAPSAASALTKDVSVGLPNRAEGKQIRADGGDANDFFPYFVAINRNDSIRFRPVAGSAHTVDIPAASDLRALRWFVHTGQDVSGANDAAGRPFWFNGQPNVFFTGQLQTRHFGETRTYNGSRRIESGRSEGSNGKAMTVKFTRTGTFNYFCDLHPGMLGTVVVRSPRRRVAGKATDAKRVTAQMKAALKTLRRLRQRQVPVDTVNVGAAGGNGVEYYGFQPSERFVQEGHTVTFRISRGSREAHTATTGPPGYLSPLAASFDGDTGPFDPRGFYPSERGRTVVALVPPSQPHGNAFWNSGLLDNAGNTSRPTSGKLKFSARGNFDFLCLIHPDMKLKVTVVSNPGDRQTGGIKGPPPG